MESSHSETESFAKLYIHLKFNETGDVIAKDNSDHDYFGILRNNAMFVAGRNDGNTALLNGIHGYVELPRDLVLPSVDFTITTYKEYLETESKYKLQVIPNKETHFHKMKAKYIFEWFYHWIHNYNLFIPDEDEYDDNSQPTDPEISLKYQRYTTRLYVFLLAVFLYILFLIALILPQTGVVIIEHVTPDIFGKLQAEHGETLSCPCSTTIVPYKDFVTNTVFYHPICSSIFVDERWIRALYLSYSSTFLVVDFRTTASFQFKLLAALCSLAMRTVTQT
ncbi:unnamed protein product, partial [Adineta ricciae]